ncbi:MAG: ABC transporter [Clostridiales bacterium]|nr:MAG: ABC transporter [Clostridiales bacterium]PIE77167.1 MAG: ABC transporter [Clostridiales bacterium]
MKIKALIEKYPFVVDYFDEYGFAYRDKLEQTLDESLSQLDEVALENLGDAGLFKQNLDLYIEQMIKLLGLSDEVTSITILPGTNKYGEAEKFSEITINKSQIISIVGPTGSGKSRLLGDIEWVASGDTPTGRSILINGEKPDAKWRFSANNKLVAQLSQNMNFVMDLSVEEFLRLHAKSRMVENADAVIAKIIETANHLSGEQFDRAANITSLSGGQSRALMIADTAILSSSPIILIDEIENAGVDRKKALDLLVSENKIVLIATHDPILALMADKRIIIKNGEILKLIDTNEEEKQVLSSLEKMDRIMMDMRQGLRRGDMLLLNDDLHF